MTTSMERTRLDSADARAWKRWGPYVRERAWGTVREDYSEDGDALASFPHNHARSRGTDGTRTAWARSVTTSKGCVRFRVLERRDPILKERIFGFIGPGKPR